MRRIVTTAAAMFVLLLGPASAVAAPSTSSLTLEPADFPPGSKAAEVWSTRYGIALSVGDGGPACSQAIAALDAARRGAEGAGSSARRGDQEYRSEVIDRPTARQAARRAAACPDAFAMRHVAPPSDLVRLSPDIFEMRSPSGVVVGMVAYADLGDRSIETAATSRDFRRDSSSIKNTQVDVAGFWHIVRTQITKIEQRV